MWDTFQLPLRGNFSFNKIASAFLAVIFSALLLTVINSTAAQAADATWKDDGSISYGDKTYQPVSPPPQGITAPAGALVFESRQNGEPTSSILFIEPNTDTTKEMKAKVADYTVTTTGEYTNPRPPNPAEISLSAKPGSKNKTQCDVAGIGWIVCVVSRFIAEGMDKIFSLISGYLEVKPVSTDTNSGLYKAWSVSLGIANLMFILAFLIIVYSQITSIGLNNYNIKKMIPKLIVAAILVNISFYICSIAVDVSNILGHSIQEALIDVRKTLPDPVSQLNWSNLTTFVLSSGTIAAGAFAVNAGFVGSAAAGSFAGLPFLLVPVLVSGALAVLVALIILAARQAIITVLIVVAPLAFVAYLLPNTEKWFEKWRDLFMTMLLVFPLFSLLFGGSQLASYIVIENTNQISVVIFAMFIQVAPLVMTPFLVKFSGSLLGRLAGMINDPKRGAVDRARGWATDRAEVAKAKGLEAASAPGGRGGNRFQRQAFRREKNRMDRESWKKRGESHVDAAWHNDSRYNSHHDSMGAAELRKKSGESEANRHFEQRRSTDKNLQNYVARERLNSEVIKNLQDTESAAWEEARTSKMGTNNRFANFSTESKAVFEQQMIAEGRLKFAQSELSDERAKIIIGNEGLQTAIGGIGGAERALAAATNEYRKNYNERVAEGNAVLKHYNLSGTEKQDHALGREISVMDDNGNLKIFRKDSTYTREAAIETQMTQGTAQEKEEIILRSGGDLQPFRTTIVQAAVDGKIGQQLIYMGGQTLNDISQGSINGEESLNNAVRSTIMKGKISPADLAGNDFVGLKRILHVASQPAPAHFNTEETQKYNQKVQSIKQAAYDALTNSNLKGSVKKNAREQLNNMVQALTGDVHDESGATVTILPTDEL